MTAAAALAMATGAASLSAQVPQLEIAPPPQYPTEQMRLDELRRVDDLRMRTEITGNRVSRQVEISRLQAQLDRLDERLRNLERRLQTSDLASVAALLDHRSSDQRLPPDETANDPAALPAGDAAAPVAAAAAPAAAASPEAAAAAGSARELNQQQITQLLVGDYLLALRGDLLEAHGEAMRETDQLQVLERLAAKGQATSGQLQLQQLKQQQAALRKARLQRQLDGLQQILPPSLADEMAPLLTGADAQRPTSLAPPAPARTAQP